jgi:hypothetical protein
MSMTLRQRIATLVLQLRYLRDKLWLLAHVWRCVPSMQATYLRGQLAGRKAAPHTTLRYTGIWRPGLDIKPSTMLTKLRPVPGSPKVEAQDRWAEMERCVRIIQAWQRSRGADALAPAGAPHQS